MGKRKRKQVYLSLEKAQTSAFLCFSDPHRATPLPPNTLLFQTSSKSGFGKILQCLLICPAGFCLSRWRALPFETEALQESWEKARQFTRKASAHAGWAGYWIPRFSWVTKSRRQFWRSIFLPEFYLLISGSSLFLEEISNMYLSVRKRLETQIEGDRVLVSEV